MPEQVTSTAFQVPWASIISASMGMVGALGGAYLANLFAEKRWEKQVAHEKRKERDKLIAEKGEEVYFLFRTWEKEIFFFNSSRIAYLQSNIREDEMRQTIDNKVSSFTHVKLNTLISLYFNELSVEFEKLQKQLNVINSIYGDGLHGLNMHSVAQKMATEAIVLERLLGFFEKKLRTKILSDK